MAALPAGSAAVEVGGEADARAWVRPRDALAAAQAGEVVMLPPTSAVLGELAEAADDVAGVLATAPGREFPRITPRFDLDDAGDVRLVGLDG